MLSPSRFFNKRKKSNNRLQIITKYKEINRGFVHNMNSCIYTDIILNDTIRIYNIHLQSNWIKTMKLSYQTRANEAVIIKKHIDNSPYPVIICGDFNDTPISYTYTKISNNLSDAFKQSGIGIGSSYIGVPFLRIDYILHDKKYKSYSYKKHKKDGIYICEKFLQENIQLTSWTPLFETKKKDDLADAFLQGIWYMKHRNIISYAENLNINCVTLS